MIQATKFTIDPMWRIILNDIGVTENEVLQRACLPLDLFSRNNAQLSVEEYFRLWRGIEKSLNDPSFPLKLAQMISVEAFSPPIFAALCSPNLNTAAERIGKYKQLVGPMTLTVEKNATSTTLSLDCLYTDHPMPESFAATELVFLTHLFRLGTREHITPLQVSSEYELSDLNSYAKFFGTMPVQGKENLLKFSKKDANLPFITENKKMWRFFEPELRKRLSKLQVRETFSDQVRNSLFELLPSGQSSTDAVAAKLAISRRTLQRRLKNEGTSFQKELNRSRESLARHYLANSSLPSTQISFLLGFDDPNSFFRAFRSWTGKTPDKMRSEIMH
ncbi:MAG: AraC family transcriptional regulator [Desulfobacteraceae bacterium]|nr:AraC family transcriptional regulator [Desulfobacteraceae bacterium]